MERHDAARGRHCLVTYCLRASDSIRNSLRENENDNNNNNNNNIHFIQPIKDKQHVGLDSRL